jgi:dTDP-L-rhamnose 4-epimerase
MDSFHPQVHGARRTVNVPSSVRLFTGDATHPPDWEAVHWLYRPSQVVHLVAENRNSAVAL